MAGTIEFSESSRWSAASWLFNWVLDLVAESVGNVELAAALKEIVDENIGWVSLADMGRVEEVWFRRVIQDSAIRAAEQSFPAAMLGRESAMLLLEELVRLASEA